MKTIAITEIIRKHTVLKEALEDGSTVRITWKEQRPGGKVIFSALITKE